MPQYQIVKDGDEFFILLHTLLTAYKYLIPYDSLRAARDVVLNWQANDNRDGSVINWQPYNVVWEG